MLASSTRLSERDPAGCRARGSRLLRLVRRRRHRRRKPSRSGSPIARAELLSQQRPRSLRIRCPRKRYAAVVETGASRSSLRSARPSKRPQKGTILGGIDARSAICVPLRARERTLGALTLARTQTGEAYGADDLALAEDLAGRIALAIDRGRLYREVEERADAARVVAHVADGVLLVDRRGVVRLWNPAAEAITAIAAADVLGHSAADAIPGWKDAVDTVPVSTSPDPGQPEVVIPFETDAGERWISISGVSFFGGTVYAFRDLTEVHRLEELKADFIATASHELRTPLAAVYGAAQTLLRHDFALDEARPRPLRLADRRRVGAPRPDCQRDPAREPARRRGDSISDRSRSTRCEVVERVVEATQRLRSRGDLAQGQRRRRTPARRGRQGQGAAGARQPRRERDQVLAGRRHDRGRRRARTTGTSASGCGTRAWASPTARSSGSSRSSTASTRRCPAA